MANINDEPNDLATGVGKGGLNVLEIAKCLGLKTKGLASFSLSCKCDSIITVTATYENRNCEIETLTKYVQANIAPTAAKPS